MKSLRKSLSIGLFTLAAASGGLAQSGNVTYQASGTSVGIGAFQRGPIAPITGAPYSATITNEMTQTLEDGTHIKQTMNGNAARDSEGRMRQDAPLPQIGNLSAANAPHIVFIQDPVAQVSYVLNLTNKTAQKMSQMPVPAASPDVARAAGGPGEVFVMRLQDGPPTAAMQIPDGPPPGIAMMQKLTNDDSSQVTTEDLGSETMQGVTVTGTRVTRVIPTGQIGNDAPITITNEVWTSPELKTVVYSKRSDPRMGVQTFQLSNITRTEPDPSLFTVPSGFTVTDGPQPILYRANR